MSSEAHTEFRNRFLFALNVAISTAGFVFDDDTIRFLEQQALLNPTANPFDVAMNGVWAAGLDLGQAKHAEADAYVVNVKQNFLDAVAAETEEILAPSPAPDEEEEKESEEVVAGPEAKPLAGAPTPAELFGAMAAAAAATPTAPPNKGPTKADPTPPPPPKPTPYDRCPFVEWGPVFGDDRAGVICGAHIQAQRPGTAVREAHFCALHDARMMMKRGSDNHPSVMNVAKSLCRLIDAAASLFDCAGGTGEEANRVMFDAERVRLVTSRYAAFISDYQTATIEARLWRPRSPETSSDEESEFEEAEHSDDNDPPTAPPKSMSLVPTPAPAEKHVPTKKKGKKHHAHGKMKGKPHYAKQAKKSSKNGSK